MLFMSALIIVSMFQYVDVMIVMKFPLRLCRALVGMMMYNPETNEIAKPSELLNGVRAYMSVLQSIENYGQSHHHYTMISFLTI